MTKRGSARAKGIPLPWWQQRGAWRSLVGSALALTMVMGAPRLGAQGAGVDSLFPAQPAGFVTDAAGILRSDVQAELARVAASLRRATGAEVAIVTLPTIGDREASEVALAILRRWGVGAHAAIGDQTRNAGLVVLLVPRPRGGGGRGHIRIEVGQGLEGIVTDAQAGRVRDAMRPELAAGDYGGGLLTGLGAIDSLVRQGLGVRPDSVAVKRPQRRSGFPVGVLVALVLFGLFLIRSSSPGGGAYVQRGSGVGDIAEAALLASMMNHRRRGWGGGDDGWGGGGGGGGFSFGGGGGGSGGGAGGDF